MDLTVLSSPVISGSMPEVRFNAVGNCTWVRFDDEVDSWAGVFGRADLSVSQAAFFNNQRHAFVVAGGRGYLVDVQSRQLLYRTEEDTHTGVLGLGSENLCVVAVHFIYLHVYSSNGCVWRSDRVALDGIILDSWDGSSVHGKAWQMDGWYAFTLSPQPWQLVLGELVTEDYSAFNEFDS